jgi:hypothetical protein
MLRWCDPEKATSEPAARATARQGVMHALVAASLLEGGLARKG